MSIASPYRSTVEKFRASNTGKLIQAICINTHQSRKKFPTRLGCDGNSEVTSLDEIPRTQLSDGGHEGYSSGSILFGETLAAGVNMQSEVIIFDIRDEEQRMLRELEEGKEKKWIFQCVLFPRYVGKDSLKYKLRAVLLHSA